jgi:hypothetical protein
VDFSPRGQEELKSVFEALQQLESHLADIIGGDRMAVLRAALEMDWGAPPVLPIAGPQAKEGGVEAVGEEAEPKPKKTRRKRQAKPNNR